MLVSLSNITSKILGEKYNTNNDKAKDEPKVLKVELIEDVEVKPIVYFKVLKPRVSACPKCGGRYHKKVVDEVLIVEGPIYSKKDIGNGNLKPLFKIAHGYKCSACEYTVTKRSIILPLETFDILKPILTPEISKVISDVKCRSERIGQLLSKLVV